VTTLLYVVDAVVVLVCRSSVEDVSTHQVAESAAASSTVPPCSLHHSMAGGLSVCLSYGVKNIRISTYGYSVASFP